MSGIRYSRLVIILRDPIPKLVDALAQVRQRRRPVTAPAKYDANLPGPGCVVQRAAVNRQPRCGELEAGFQGVTIRRQKDRSRGGQVLHADGLELKLAQALEPK